jgi:predicted ATPase/class 3 adenylate cyclase
MGGLPEGTLTFLLTDIEGSTRLWEHEPDAMAVAMVRHDLLFEMAVHQHAGHVVRPRGEGDSRFAVFTGAPDAVSAVSLFQQSMHAEDWSTTTELRVRAALHTGEADLRQGDYYGSTVNRCARIRALAHGGQVLVSAATAALVRDVLASGITLEDLGEYELRDLTEPERIYQVNVGGLPQSFPPLASSLQRPNNLPAETSTFVGRKQEITAIRTHILDPLTRLVSLIGPGGSGKTRLALHVARSLLPEFRDGVFFVPLAAVQDAALVIPTIARTLGVQIQGDESAADALHDYLNGKLSLLVLDNMDHLLDAAPDLGNLLSGCPHLTLLVTSRETLRLRGNREIYIHPLDVPDTEEHLTVEQALQFASVRLFVERAREGDPAFEITSENTMAIIAICQRLDGLPLAIELAAARIRLFSPQALLARLDRRLPILTGGAVDMPSRHQTLRNTIAWSYDFLEPWEQVLFRRLAVFRGGFTLDAAAAVCRHPTGDESAGEVDLLDGIASLVSKSLARRSSIHTSIDEPRFGMLTTIREYGFEQMEQHGEIRLVRDQHAEYFTALAERAETALPGPEQAHWLQVLDTELSNLRAALAWSFDSANHGSSLRLVAALWPFWDLRGYIDEGHPWLDRALATDGPPELRARVLSGAGTFAWTQGDYERATTYHAEALDLFRERDDRAGEAFALNNLAVQQVFQGDLEQASQLFQESLALYERLNDERGIADVVNNLGGVASYQSDTERAEALLQRSLALRRHLGNDDRVAETLYNLAELAYDRQDFAHAWRQYQESLSLLRHLGTGWRTAACLAALAATAAGMDKLERAARLSGAAQSLLQSLGATLDSVEQSRFDGVISAIRARLGDDLSSALWTEGRLMAPDEAIDYGLAPLEPYGYQPAVQNIGGITLGDAPPPH